MIYTQYCRQKNLILNLFTRVFIKDKKIRKTNEACFSIEPEGPLVNSIQTKLRSTHYFCHKVNI